MGPGNSSSVSPLGPHGRGTQTRILGSGGGDHDGCEGVYVNERRGWEKKMDYLCTLQSELLHILFTILVDQSSFHRGGSIWHVSGTKYRACMWASRFKTFEWFSGYPLLPRVEEL